MLYGYCVVLSSDICFCSTIILQQTSIVQTSDIWKFCWICFVINFSEYNQIFVCIQICRKQKESYFDLILTDTIYCSDINWLILFYSVLSMDYVFKKYELSGIFWGASFANDCIHLLFFSRNIVVIFEILFLIILTCIVFIMKLRITAGFTLFKGVYSVMQSNRNNFCGDDVDSVNMVFSHHFKWKTNTYRFSYEGFNFWSDWKKCISKV